MSLTTGLAAQCDITLTLTPEDGVVENYTEPAVSESSKLYSESLYLVEPIQVLAARYS